MLSTSKLFRNPSAAGATDPYFKYVPLLLETTTTNGQQNNTFLDSSTNNFTITRNGTPTQGSVTPYWPDGYWGNYFNGSTDSVSTTQSMVLPTSTTPFTIELWANFTSFSSVAIASTTNSSGIFFVLGMGTGNGGATGATPWFGYFNGSAWTSIQSSTSLVVGTWYHLAYVFTGSTATIYANGIVIASGSVASWQTTGGTGLYIGRRWDTSTPGPYFNGYISNFRYVIGAALYSGSSTTVPNFTVPTTPLTSSPSSGTTKILTCQSNRFKDNSANNYALTANGTPLVQAFQPFSPAASYTPAAYGGSGYFNGSNDWLSIPDNAAFALGSGDFTAECWIYPTSFANEAQIMGQWSGDVGGTTLNFALLLSSGSTGYVRLITSSNGSSVLFDLSTSTTSFTLTLNSWQHIAAVRSGSTFTIYVNGISRASTTNASGLFDATNAFTIGAESNTQSQYFTGYISNARLIKGTAVYTGAFTPPTLAPLTTAGSTSAASYSSTTNVNTVFGAGNTSLLLNFTNAGIYDAAVQNNALTVGDAQSSTTITAKWPPTSMKFDGTGDWLTMPGANIPALAGQFTIEFWVYFSSISATVQTICGKWNTSLFGWLVQINNTSVQFSYGNGVTFTATLSYATTITTGTWYYIAITRNSSNAIQAYLNGSAIGSPTTVSTSLNSTSAFSIGVNLDASQQPLNGYLQDFRLTNGVARTITTPTAAFPTR